METLERLLPIGMLNAIYGLRICELRLRIGKPLRIYNGSVWSDARIGDVLYIVSKSDVDYIIGVASGYSVYSINDSLVRGYLHYEGGIRIGVAGEGVMDGAKLTTQKYLSYLTIRVPTEVKGCADKIFNKICDKGEFKNTLVISPTAGGKTTMLREIARLTSNSGLNVLVIDERFELCAEVKGLPTFDIGVNTDVISGVPKLIAYENTIRAMNPDVIISDEVFKKEEIDAVIDACRAGVKVGLSVHAESDIALKSTVFSPLLDIMQVIIVLSKQVKAGTVVKVIEKC
ncbi:MAG: ATPase, T2SS/T4P/T4SS family [Clostridia bacterium]